MGPADVGEVAKLGKVVAGAGSDHNLRSEQAKMVAGRCTRNNLPSADGRPMRQADLGEVAEKIRVVVGMCTRLNLLFQTAG